MRLVLFALAGLLAAPAAFAQTGVCTGGTATLNGVNYDCDRVDIVANVGPVGGNGPFRAARLNDIWGWTDPQNGDEYAIVGTTRGTNFVDVSVPEAPRVLGRMEATNGQNGYSTWRDIKVYQNHAFVVADRPNQAHGMQVFDLTRLRGLSEDPSRDFTPDVLYAPVFDAHNIVINEDTGFAYAVGGRITPGSGVPSSCISAGFHAIDISDPVNPTFAGCFSDISQESGPRNPGYTHDAQCVVYDGPDTDHTGSEICIGANEDVVTVFDVSDKDDVTILSQTAYPQFSYTHQGWLTEDQRYFLANDELDERNTGINQRTLVLDMVDLDSPEFLYAYDSGLNTIDHNLYTRGDYAFESNYTEGLRILDVSDAGNGLSEAAFFDTYPQGASNQDFSGAWSNYPYFDSGIVIVSDINNGLFVLRPDSELVAVDSDDAPSATVSALSVPRPNPTAGTSELTLTVETAQSVRAEVYDVSGRRVATLFEGTATPGSDVLLTVDGADLPAGVYVIRVQGETFDATQRLTLTR